MDTSQDINIIIDSYDINKYSDICKDDKIYKLEEFNILMFISSYFSLLSTQEHKFKLMNRLEHLQNIFNIIKNIRNKVHNSLYFNFIEMVCCTLGGQSILKKSNLNLLTEDNIHILLRKTSAEGTMPNLNILIDHVIYKKYILNDEIKNSCIVASFKNSDDRVYKYFLTKENITFKDNDMCEILDNIFSKHIPHKYIMKRLMALNKIVKLEEGFNRLIQKINDIDGYYSAYTIFKYYYNGQYLEENTLAKLVRILEYYNYTSYDQLEECKLKCDYFYNKLKNNIDKNIFACEIFYSNICYVLPIIPNVDMGKYNKERILSCVFRTIMNWDILYKIKKPICNNIFKLFKPCDLIPQYYMYSNINSILYLFPFIKHFNTNLVSNWGNNNMMAIKMNKCLYLFRIYIRKYRKNKIISRKLILKPILNEMINMKPTNTVKVLKSGTNFYSNMLQKFNTIPPYHIVPGQINILDNILIREKADGVMVMDLPNYIYPSINKYKLKAEYIDFLDLYLVYDIDINYNIIDRYQYLRDMHPSTKNTILENISSPEELLEKINIERNNIEKFLEEPYDNYRWYPKAAWKISSMNPSFINFINNYLNSNFSTSEIIPTDGFIISPLNGNREIKVKPKNFMTIDLLYRDNKWYDRDNNIYNIIKTNQITDNTIWRCYPTEELCSSGTNTMYEARELRTDKTKPNSRNIVNNIINLYKINHMVSYPSIYHSKLSEYKKDTNWKNIINVNIFTIKKMLKKLSCKNIIDLGGGNGKLLKYVNNFKTYHCVDMDVNMLARGVYHNMQNMHNNIIFNNTNLAIDWNQPGTNWYDITNRYDTVIAVNSLQHFNTEIFWNQLNKITDKNTYMLFNLLTMNDNIKYNFDNSYIERKGLNISYYFENVHSHEMNEPYIYNIFQILEKYGWKVIETYTPVTELLPKYYTWYIVVKN